MRRSSGRSDKCWAPCRTSRGCTYTAGTLWALLSRSFLRCRCDACRPVSSAQLVKGCSASVLAVLAHRAAACHASGITFDWQAQDLVLDGYLGAHGLPTSMAQGCTTLTRQVSCAFILPGAGSTSDPHLAQTRAGSLPSYSLHMPSECWSCKHLTSQCEFFARQARSRPATTVPWWGPAGAAAQRCPDSPLSDARPGRAGAGGIGPHVLGPPAGACCGTTARVRPPDVTAHVTPSLEATALYLWLQWALPAAPQLRKLSVRGSGGHNFEGLCQRHSVCLRLSSAPLHH